MSVIKSICRLMERLAPVPLAEKWDNVGLLLESPVIRQNANRILLTIDLTTEVAEEALSTPTCCIISYHPTIFRPLASLTLKKPLQRTLLRCAAAGISVYCPHTSLDSVDGGINDWLARGVSVFANHKPSVSYISDTVEGLGGTGRLVTYDTPISMVDLQRAIKSFLKLDQIQVAYPAGFDPESPNIRTVGIGAGSAGSLAASSGADVYFTGEMVHHEVLAAVATGHCVILCGHTNTERGYLPELATKIRESIKTEEFAGLTSLEVFVSEKDKDPLVFV